MQFYYRKIFHNMENFKKVIIKLIYNTIKISNNKKSLNFLGFISFIEAIFFPIPPDIFLIPIILAKRYSWLFLCLLTTFFSILGGVLGYVLGAFFWDLIGVFIIEIYGGMDKINYLKDLFESHGWVIILIAGFTPIPYKIFTLGSGFLYFNFFLFIICSVLSRGLRFFLLAYLVNKYGEKSIKLVEKYFLHLTLSITFIFIVILTLFIY